MNVSPASPQPRPVPATASGPAAPAEPWENLDNLDSLTFSFPGQDGTPKTGWAIYAEPVDRKDPLGPVHQVGAPNEGFSCVDDVARVALVYLDQFEKTGKPELAGKATQAVQFCLNQQDGQGHYYNFVNQDGTINKTGPTSEPGLNWWTARAFWALSRAERVLGPTADPKLKDSIDQALDKTLDRLEESEKDTKIPPELAGVYAETGVKPGSLVDHSGSITSIFALGLLERVKAKEAQGLPDPRDKALLETYCDAMTKLARPSDDPFTGDMHINSMWDPKTVHLYGNRQVQALASAGQALNRPDWIESARREADHAYPRMLASYLVPFAFSPSPEPNPQIAYAAEAVVSNLQAVYRATGENKYSMLAGLYGTWFNGANAAGLPVYNRETGRSFDGVDATGVSTNSGAESNVETQLAMASLQGSPGEALLDYGKTVSVPAEKLLTEDALKVASGAPTTVSRTLNGGAVRKEWQLTGNDALSVAEPNPADTDYVTWKSEGGALNVQPDGSPAVTVPASDGGWQVTRLPAASLYKLGGNVEIDSVVERSPELSRQWTDGGHSVQLKVDSQDGNWQLSR